MLVRALPLLAEARIRRCVFREKGRGKLEVISRSFPEQLPIALKPDLPLWIAAGDQPLGNNATVDDRPRSGNASQDDAMQQILDALSGGGKTNRQLQAATNFGSSKITKLVGKLADLGKVRSEATKNSQGRNTTVYHAC